MDLYSTLKLAGVRDAAATILQATKDDMAKKVAVPVDHTTTVVEPTPIVDPSEKLKEKLSAKELDYINSILKEK